MTVAQKLKAMADLVEDCEYNFDSYSKCANDETNSESTREYYAYKAELYKAMRETILSKASKL